MQNLKLVKPTITHQAMYEAMMDEWLTYGGRLNPGALKMQEQNYATWLENLKLGEAWETCEPDMVPQHLYFLMDKDDQLLGAIAIRTELDDEFFETGGHIGYGIRPSERGKGYGKMQLKLALRLCKELYHLDRVLITCDTQNAASAAVILANHGVYENDAMEDDGSFVSRYWIDL